MRWIFLIVFVVLSLVIINSAIVRHTPFERAVADEVMVLRGQVMKPSKKLKRASEARSEQVCTDGDFSHDGFLGVKQGFVYGRAAELLATNFNTPEGVVDAWIDSDDHNVHLLDGELTHYGVTEDDGCVVMFLGVE